MVPLIKSRITSFSSPLEKTINSSDKRQIKYLACTAWAMQFLTQTLTLWEETKSPYELQARIPHLMFTLKTRLAVFQLFVVLFIFFFWLSAWVWFQWVRHAYIHSTVISKSSYLPEDMSKMPPFLWVNKLNPCFERKHITEKRLYINPTWETKCFN